MENFNKIDDLFKQLNKDSLTPGSRVWAAVDADQRRKRRGIALWWWVPLLLIAGGGFGFWALQSEADTKLAAAIVSQHSQEVIESTKSSQQIENGQLAIQVPKNRPDYSSLKVSATNYLHPVADNAVDSKANPVSDNVSIASGEKAIEPKLEDVVTMNSIETKEPVLSIENTKSILEAKADDGGMKQPETEKKKNEAEKTKRPTFQRLYLDVSIPLVRCYRRLKTNDPSLTAHKALRNFSEITLHTAGFNVSLACMLTPKSSLNVGLMYLTQGLSSSFRDTFGGFTQNGNQKFHDLKVPLLYSYYFTTKSHFIPVFYVSGGMNVNMLLAVEGSVLDLNASVPGQLVNLSNQPLKKAGSEFCVKWGATFTINPKDEVLLNATGAFSPFSAFNANYPIIQNNFYYGFELGVRRRL